MSNVLSSGNVQWNPIGGGYIHPYQPYVAYSYPRTFKCKCGQIASEKDVATKDTKAGEPVVSQKALHCPGCGVIAWV